MKTGETEKGMQENWKTYKLDKLGTIARGKSKHRPRDAAHLYGGDYPFVQTGDVKAANHRLTKYTQTYSEAGLAQSKLWPKNTMCITIAANIAETAILDFPACFPDSIIGFIADENVSDIDFVEYLMQYFRKQIQSHSIGSVQDNINLATFQKIEFKVPLLPEQRAIASILSALDDKIELNLQTNKTLEEMAMTLYKHWFVDFGPFRDGNFVDSELGMIPEGWEVKKLGDICDIGSSKRIFLSEYVESGIPFLRGKEVIQLSKGQSISTELFISAERFKSIKEKFGVPLKGDILISSVGTIGVSWMVDNENSFYFKDGNVTWIKNYSPRVRGSYISQWLKSPNCQEQIKSETIGSTQQALTISALKTLEIVLPPEESRIVNEVSKELELWNDQIVSNKFETQTLTTLRDTLLPKLISGEVRVRDAEKLLSDVL